MTSIVLPESCTRSAAEALLPEVIAALGEGPVTIDARSVTRIGQACLQLLVSARRSPGGATILASVPLREAAVLTGLEQALFDGETA
ncbi:MAG TPA: STAS domain-containing protein [Novosphingobium sp.]|nr:STAS domain-containing protein [Novosphingobium sp.]